MKLTRHCREQAPVAASFPSSLLINFRRRKVYLGCAATLLRDRAVGSERNWLRNSKLSLQRGNRCHARMSAIETLIEKVRQLDEAHARQLTWLQGQERTAALIRQPAGAMAMSVSPGVSGLFLAPCRVDGRTARRA